MKIAGVELKGAVVLVVGMAKSGVAAAQLLRARGAVPVACDAKPLAELPADTREALQGIEFRLQSPDAAQGAALVVLSPGVPPDIELVRRAREHGVPIVGELELASYFLQGKSIGIIGTNGKTTTTALVGHILHESGIAAQVGGNIGTPPSAMVASSQPGQWNVLELSSFQTESINHFRADIAVCLNVTPDHLDRYVTFADYTAAKRRLFETLNEDAYAVLNADDEHCVNFANSTRARVLWFSAKRRVTPGVWVENGEIRYQGEPLMKTEDIPLRGRHNWENVLAAATVARLSGASLSQLAAAVRSFQGVEHRIEFVRRVGGVSFYNDSKATNVDAALKSLDSFNERLFVILGGKDKGSDYRPLAAPLKERAVAALLIGQASQKIETAVKDSVPVVRCDTLEAAVEIAYSQARAGDVVLLAPACASFDQFDNYEHRGRVFKQAVAALAEKNG